MKSTATFSVSAPSGVDSPADARLPRAARNGLLAVVGTMAGLLSSTALTFAADAIAPGTLPQGGTVAAGSATFDYSQANKLTVNQASQRALLDWTSFNIGENAATHFNQINSGAIAVNRVHDVNPSQILGSLTATGKVVVLNQNGVFFGNNAHVDVGALMVSTGEIDANAFNSTGAVKLSGINANPDARIVNKGSITVKDGGIAAFVAPNVINDGVITARLGKVALAAGADKATVDLYGDGLVELALDDKASKALIENNGTIKADGGTVALTAAAAKDVVDSVINMGGVVEANAVAQQGGTIILGATNADIAITGKATAAGGKGRIAARTNRNLKMTQAARLDVDAGVAGTGGTATLIADGVNSFAGTISGRGGAQAGNGGTVEVSGYEGLDYQGHADLTAANGQLGSLLLDPRFTVIYNGIVPVGSFQQYVLSSSLLAAQLKSANVTLQADEFIDVGTRPGNYSLSISGNPLVNAALNIVLNALPDGAIDLSNSFGTTAGSLTLQSQTVNFNRTLTMGTGAVAVNAPTVNLGAKLYSKTGGSTVLLNDARLSSNAATVNVRSNAAAIQQGVFLADDAGAGTVNVAAGTYAEDVVIDKQLALKGAKAGQTSNAVGRGTNETVITPTGTGIFSTAFNVLIDGFTVRNGVTGILADGGSAQIVNNIVTGSTQNGIHVSGTNGGQIARNTVRNTGNDGIYARSARNLSINTNILSNSGRDAVNVSGGDTIVIGGASASDGNAINGADRDGIHVDGTSIVDVRNNNIFGNETQNGADRNAIDIQNATTALIGANTISGATAGFFSLGFAGAGRDGIRVDKSTGVLIDGNTIQAGGGFLGGTGGLGAGRNGVYVTDVTGLGVTNNDLIAGIDTVAPGITAPGSASAGWNGIRLKDVTGALVDANAIDGTGMNGVEIKRGTGTTVSNNTISNTAENGVNVYDGAANVTVSGNTIFATGLNGVLVSDSANTNITANIFNSIAQDGIRLFNSTAATVQQNELQSIGGNGISVSYGSGHTLSNNLFDVIGQDGIDVFDVDGISSVPGITITGNNLAIFTDVPTIGGHGISLTGSSYADVSANSINNTVLDGVHVRTSNNATINGNSFSNNQHDAINLSLAENASVTNNSITHAGRDGVHAENSNNLTVRGNSIAGSGLTTFPGYLGAGRNAIHVENSDVAIIDANRITGNIGVETDGTAGAGRDGIRVADVNNVTVSNNTFQAGNGFANASGGRGANRNGIYMTDTENATVINNQFVGGSNFLFGAGPFAGAGAAGWNGIRMKDNTNATVSGNSVSATGMDGIQLTRETGATVAGNVIDDTAENGIDIIDSTNVAVTGNNVGSLVAGDGIFIDPSSNLTIANNTINLVGGTGVYVAGQGNGLITLSGNTINSLAGNTGARFESGTLDFTGAANTINGGAVGMLFDPTAGGTATGLSLVNNAIGSTLFTGQSQYYVELENGAFFAPGTPTQMDGNSASFDGLTPGAMTDAQYNTLRSRVFDFQDLNTLGLFFPDRVNAANINNILLRGTLLRVASFRVPLVTILGLPLAPGQQLPANALNNLNSAAGLNSIASAAGGDRNGGRSQFSVQSTPNNGNVGEEFAARLNDVEASAGERTVGCWGGVYNSLGAQGTGTTPVTYSLNTSPVVQISDAATCNGGV